MDILKDTEQLDDLGLGGLAIIQDKSVYSFTTDAVLLANFVKVKSSKNVVVDLGSGSGIIATIIAYKQNPKMVYGIELQQKLFDMACRSVSFNKLENIKMINCDILESHNILGREIADIIVTNPPYRKLGSGETQLNEIEKICRHEVKINLQQVIESGERLLKSKGAFYIVHQSDRTAEIFYYMTKSGIEPKEITTVCQRRGLTPNLVLIKGIKAGNVGLKWNSPLIIFDEQNNYTDEIKNIYSDVKKQI